MLKPEVLRWARERGPHDLEALAKRINVKPERVLGWERSGKISVAQADKLAHHTHTPVGFLYLPEPPEDRLPIPDFRTRRNDVTPRPSPNLLETVYLMQRRQTWMREELTEEGSEPLGFVGAHTVDSNPLQVADAIRTALQLERNWASRQSTWTAALSHLREQADRAGVLVVFSGIVGNNTHRKLETEEFQGFALVDEYAPLVFVNSADFRAAQMFTLAHEIAHLFVGETGVSSFDNLQPTEDLTEQFCNRIAAEFLAPEEELRAFWPSAKSSNDPYRAIARRFKVSSLVAARRALDLKLIDLESFFSFYEESKAAIWLSSSQESSSDGNFWNTQKWRIGPRFGAAVARAVREGRLLYREAYSLTGLRGNTFEKMPDKLGVVL